MKLSHFEAIQAGKFLFKFKGLGSVYFFGQLGHPLTDFLGRFWGEKNDKKVKNIHSILFFVVQLDFSEPSNNGFIVEKSWFLFSLGNDLKKFKIEKKNWKNAFQGHN